MNSEREWWAFKMKVEDDEYDETMFWDDEDEDVEDYDESADLKTLLEEIPDNKCKDWVFDNKMFELPENIDFSRFLWMIWYALVRRYISWLIWKYWRNA